MSKASEPVKVVITNPELVEPTTVEPVTATVATKRFNPKWWIVLGVLLLAAGVLGIAAYAKLSTSGTDGQSVLGQITDIVTKRNDPVKGEAKDRVNVLLLGIGGGNHPGATLTDSIMVASIKPSTKQVSLFSLPRDLIVLYGQEGRKINNAYAFGGMDMAIDKVETVTGLKIQYYVLLDFSGFRTLIDDVEGVDITVPHSFIGLYGANELANPCPAKDIVNLEDGAYCKITFTTGEQHMDGERALIYARIRKLASTSPNKEEGGDFARAQRQQQVLEAFKQKVLSANTFLNPSKVTSLLGDLDDHMVTNVELWESARFLELIGDVGQNGIINKVVDNSPGGLVTTTVSTETGASVVVPTAGDYNYSEIQALAKDIFNQAPTETATAESLASDTRTSIQVLNGTGTRGYGTAMSEMLEANGFTITNVGNAFTSDYTATTIYQINADVSADVVTQVQNTAGGALASQRQTDTLLSLDETGAYLDSAADFIIIVGTDANLTPSTQE